METVTATELHDRTADLTDRVMRDPERPIVVEKHGKPAVVLVDARYFEGLLETLDLLADPEAMRQIRRGIADIKAGRVIDHERVRKAFGFPAPAGGRKVVGVRTRRAASNRKPDDSRKNLRKAG